MNLKEKNALICAGYFDMVNDDMGKNCPLSPWSVPTNTREVNVLFYYWEGVHAAKSDEIAKTIRKIGEA